MSRHDFLLMLVLVGELIYATNINIYLLYPTTKETTKKEQNYFFNFQVGANLRITYIFNLCFSHFTPYALLLYFSVSFSETKKKDVDGIVTEYGSYYGMMTLRLLDLHC